MGSYQTLSLLIAGLCLIGCTADVDAPVNQTYPIRQMDRFFDSLTGPPTPRDYTPRDYTPRDYTGQSGYAPAYPAY